MRGMTREKAGSAGRLEVRDHRLLTWGSLMVISAYGLLLLVPTLGVLLVVNVSPYGPWTWLLPLSVLVGSLYLLPLGFGNPKVRNLVRALDGEAGIREGRFVVQLTCEPRLASGLRGLLEDADDIGCLRLEAGGLVYLGDRVTLEVPYGAIERVQRLNIGWRGLYLYQSVVRVEVAGLDEVEALRFSERSAWALPGAVRAARRLAEEVRKRAQA